MTSNNKKYRGIFLTGVFSLPLLIKSFTGKISVNAQLPDDIAAIFTSKTLQKKIFRNILATYFCLGYTHYFLKKGSSEQKGV